MKLCALPSSVHNISQYFTVFVRTAQFCVVVAGNQGGYDGIAVSPIYGQQRNGTQMNIDWVGSTDQNHAARDIEDRAVIGAVVYDAASYGAFARIPMRPRLWPIMNNHITVGS